MNIEEWTIEGSRGNPIYGTMHSPNERAKGVVLLAHGFMGYKEYGMFPWLAQQFAELGYIAHRFNFSHSGMLPGDGPFERVKLFEQATWNRQVEDIEILVSAVKKPDMPLYLFGHSRGGVSTLLSLGRRVVEADGAIVLSSPSHCLTMTKEQQESLLAAGSMELPSGRTGQTLHAGKAFLHEQLEDPEGHDLLALASTIDVPVLVVHGDKDPTVPPSCGEELQSVLENGTLAFIPGGNHVLNTTNPFPVDGEPSEQLAGAWCSIATWLS